MDIVIREANINRDRQILIDFLYQHLTKHSDDRFFDWRYLNNPYGTARAWIAFDEKKEIVIGVAAAFPRLMQVCGENLVCWNLGDFVISNGFRSLGPALLLQRACLASVLEGEIPFCYDHPNSRMMTIYKRMGISACGQVPRFVKPLKVDRKVREFVGEGALARGLSALGNLFLTMRDRRSHAYQDYEIALHEGRFGEEFSQLDDRVAGRFKVCGRRTAEYLNWRYLDNPLCRYEVVTVRHQGELLAYAVFINQVGQDVTLADLFGEKEAKVMEALLTAVVEILRRRKILTLSAPILDSNPLISLLKRAGFYPRESSPVVVCTQPSGRLARVVTEKENWFLTHGDRDI